MKHTLQYLFLLNLVALLITLTNTSCQKSKEDQCHPAAVIFTSTNGSTAYGPDTTYYFYDKSGRLQNVESPNYTWHYSWSDHSLKVENFEQGVLRATTTHDLDDEGRSVVEKLVNNQGASNGYTSSRTYNSEGYPQQIITTQENGSVSVIQNTWVDGNLKKVVSTTGSGSSTSNYEYYTDLATPESWTILPIYGRGSKNLLKKVSQSNNSTINYFYTLNESGQVKTETIQLVNPSYTYGYEGTYYYDCK